MTVGLFTGAVLSVRTATDGRLTELSRHTPSSGPGNPGLVLTGRVVAVLLLCGVLPVTLLWPSSEAFSTAFFVQSVVVVHSGAALALALTAPEIRIVRFGFWTFSYVWMGLAPLAMLVTGRFPWSLTIDSETALIASLIVEAGLIAYTIALVLASLTGPPARSGILARAMNRRFRVSGTLIVTAISFLLMAMLLPRRGGLSAAFLPRQEAAGLRAEFAESIDTSSYGLLQWAMLVSAMWAMLGLWRIRSTASVTYERVLTSALLVAMVGVNVVVNNPVSQPRFWAGTVWLAALFSSALVRRLWAFRLAAWATVLSAAVLFPYTDYFRRAESDVVVSSVAGQLSSNGDYDGYQQVAAGISMVSETGHLPSYALSLPLSWVPRSWWPGKPESLGVEIAEWVGYSFTRLSSPLWIETYVWGGFAAVVAVFAGLGWLSCRLDQWNWALRRDTLALAGTLVPALAIFQLFAIRGPLLAAAAPLLMMIIIPLLMTSASDRPRDEMAGTGSDRGTADVS